MYFAIGFKQGSSRYGISRKGKEETVAEFITDVSSRNIPHINKVEKRKNTQF